MLPSIASPSGRRIQRESNEGCLVTIAVAVTRRRPTYFAPIGYPEALRIRREFNKGRLVTVLSPIVELPTLDVARCRMVSSFASWWGPSSG